MGLYLLWGAQLEFLKLGRQRKKKNFSTSW